MANQDSLLRLQEHLLNVLELKLELARTLEELLRDVVALENDFGSEINWSYLLRDLHNVVYQVDVNEAFRFVDDIEEQINDIPYKVRRATSAMRTAVNPVLRKTPVYLDAAHPPIEEDYSELPPVEKQD